MENKYINRYNTFCKSLKNLEKSLNADPKADFVLEGTVLNFNLTFDISWKVMKDILIKEMEILGFFAAEKFQDIIKVYYPLFQKLKEDVEKYYVQKESC